MTPPSLKNVAWPALVTVASAAATVFWWQLPAAQLGLEARVVAPDQLRITWNRHSTPALLASSALLEIHDGPKLRRLVLTGDQLRGGSLTYRLESGDIRIRLGAEENVRWARLKPVYASVRFATPKPPVETVLVRLTEHPSPSGPMAQQIRTVRAAGGPPHASADRVNPVRRPAVIPDKVRSSRADSTLPVAPAPPPLAIPEPAVSQISIAALPAPVRLPRQPVYAGPRSGRVIWTGSMARRGVVEIEGTHASIGSITGGLPGVPVNVRVSPAEFSPQGLVVHTTDAGANDRREGASAVNGWNATLFRWEPDRARQLVVLESPNPSNEFGRLVVRNDARACSVILVEWSVR